MNNIDKMIAWMHGGTDVSPFGDSILRWGRQEDSDGIVRQDAWGYVTITLIDQDVWYANIAWNESETDVGTTHGVRLRTAEEIYDLLAIQGVIRHVERLTLHHQAETDAYEAAFRAWALGGERVADAADAFTRPTYNTIRFCAGEGRPTFDFTFDGDVWRSYTGHETSSWGAVLQAAEESDPTFGAEQNFYFSQFYPED